MANTQQFSKLKFRVVSCNSEDREFPVTELLKHGPHSKGWQSGQFCDYPQEIILQFPNPVKIKQLQFLAHQSKIPTKIELFTYIPEGQGTIPDVEQIKFTRLGHLSLADNEKSNFQARELKSVYIDSPTLYLKILLHKCHVNRYNVFNQVGLVAFNSLGENMSYEEAGLSDGPERIVVNQGHPDRLENAVEFDQITGDRLKALNSAKTRAIENEDFDEAKRLKDAVERLKSVGYQLLQLEDRKRIAIDNEDFDSAKIVKLEIDRLRNAVAPPISGVNPSPNYFAPVQQSSHRPFSGGPKPLPGSRPGSQLNQGAPGFAPPGQTGFQPPGMTGFQPPTQMAPQSLVPNEQPAFTGDREDIFGKPKEDIFAQSRQGGPGASASQFYANHQNVDANLNIDEQVIPTMAYQKPNAGGPGEEREVGMADMNEPEPLSNHAATKADALLPTLGEDIVRRLFSKTWQFREDALHKIEKELAGGQLFQSVDNATVFSVVLGAVRHTIPDKVAQVAISSMDLAKSLIEQIDPRRVNLRGDVPEHFHKILEELLNKVGDGNVRLRDNAEQTFLQLTRAEVVGVGQAVQAILKPMANQKSQSQRHIIGRLSLLNHIVQEYKIDVPQVPFQPVVEYALNGFKNSNGEIRTASYNLLLSIFSCVGQKLMPYLQGLRPAQVEMLQNGFSQLEQGPVNMNPEQSDKNEDRPIKPAARQRKPAGGKPEQQENSGPACQYCGRQDPAFASDDKLDLHYFKDCPMLVICPSCNQVVETKTLNAHLLGECEGRDHEQCPRCKEAVHISEFDVHVEEQACLQAKPITKANRCPLCHEDIAPGDNGWHQHFMVEGCPNNDRGNF